MVLHFCLTAGQYQYSGEGEDEGLTEAVPGSPGQDYPVLHTVPDTSFSCTGQVIHQSNAFVSPVVINVRTKQVNGGYYADPEADCQLFHICAGDEFGLTKYSFLCPNGTLFNQPYFVCDWWFNVDCGQAEQFYSLNEEIAANNALAEAESGGSVPVYRAGAASTLRQTYTRPAQHPAPHTASRPASYAASRSVPGPAPRPSYKKSRSRPRTTAHKKNTRNKSGRKSAGQKEPSFSGGGAAGRRPGRSGAALSGSPMSEYELAPGRQFPAQTRYRPIIVTA